MGKKRPDDGKLRMDHFGGGKMIDHFYQTEGKMLQNADFKPQSKHLLQMASLLLPIAGTDIRTNGFLAALPWAPSFFFRMLDIARD